jgi:DNA modification methylase
MIELIQGECLTEMQKIQSGSVDAIITDPPYGTTACKWDSVIPFDLMWEQLNRIIKPNGAIVLFGSEPFSSALRMSNIKNYKYDWVWKKPRGTGHLNAKKMPMRDTENISIFNVHHSFYNAQKSIGEPYKPKSSKVDRVSEAGATTYGKFIDGNSVREENKGFRYPKTLIEFGVVERGTVHPTQKPVLLMEYLIKTYTNENETVLDFTMGSGSTGVAAKNLNRSFIGIEQDQNYFKIAKERINKPDLFTLDTK